MISGLVYSVGVISLLTFDLMYAQFSDAESIAYWAEMKSFMMMVAPILTLGINALIVRFPERKNDFMSYYRTFFVVFSIPILCVGLIFDDVVYFFMPMIFALNLIAISYYRCERKIILAQLTQNLWKIVLCVMLIFSYFDGTNFNAVITCFWVLFFSSIMAFSTKKIGLSFKSIKKDDFILSSKFLISTFLASASVYFEVYTSAKFFNDDISASYFIHYSLLSAAAFFVSGFVGFLLTPSIKLNNIKYEMIFFNSQKMFFIIAVVSLLVIIQFFIVGEVFQIFYEQYEFYPLLSVIMSCSVVARIAYIIPTSYLGALSSKNDFDEFLVASFLSLVIMLLIFTLLRFLGVNDYIALALASLFNWMLRLLFAYRSALFLYRKKMCL